MFRSIALVSASTLISRVLGVMRDSVMFAFLGASPWSAAFLMAFTLPNLFRRLLGEGALTSAIIPVFSHIKDDQKAQDLLNRLISALNLILWGLSGLIFLALQFIPYLDGFPERVYLAAELGQGLIFYMPLICLAAIFSARLNQKGHFGVGALAPIALNLCMVLALGLAYVLGLTSDAHYVVALSWGVIAGGVLQLIWPLVVLIQKGWKPKFTLGQCEALLEIRKLFLPAALAAAIFQLNLLVSRLLAFTLDDAAIGLLYLASRLVELPMGLFTLAVATVMFPKLSELAARQEEAGLERLYQQGLRVVLGVSLPAMVGLIALADPIVRVLFEWGAFQSDSAEQATRVLQASALTIPFYAWATVSTRALHALKDTKSPMQMAFFNFLINAFFSLILMQFYGVLGLVAGGLIAVMVQAFCLHHFCQKRFLRAHFEWKLFAKMALWSFFMGGLAYGGHFGLMHIWGSTKLHQCLSLLCFIPLGGLVYLIGCLLTLQTEEMTLLKSFLRKR
jgi:putative peptidoglycan lipid II flippase